MLAPGLANLCWRSISCSGCLRTLFADLLKKLLFLRRTLLLRLQGYQTCGGAGMLVPFRAQRFAHCFSDFGGLLKKLLFLGRTLLLRLWVFGTHVRKRLGRLGEQPAQLGASNPVLIQECWLQG